MYLKLKQYINNNKQLLIIYVIMALFLIIHNKVYCDPSFFQKWYLNTENYFLNLTWEKAIKDVVDLPKSVGWVSVGAIGSLYVFEGIWNVRRLGSILLYKYTPLGHLDDGSGVVKFWFGFRNTAGPLKSIIDTVPYEEILPLYWARKYVFPNLFIKTSPSKDNSSQIDTKPTITVNNNPVIRPNIPEITSINNIEPQIVEREVEKIVHINHYFEVPVYVKQYVPVVEYRDRDNLVKFTDEVRGLKTVVQESNLIQRGVNFGSEGIAQELSVLHQYNDFNFLKNNNISDKFFLKSISFQFTPRTEKVTFEFIFGSLRTSNLKDVKHRMNFLDWRNEFPILSDIFNVYSDLDLLNHSQIEGALARPSFVFLNLNYKNEQTGFFGISVIDAYNCTFSAMTIDSVNAIDVGVNILLRQNESSQGRIDELITKLENKINNEQRLIQTETVSQGTQTAYFDLNETIFDRINTFLEIRDETSFVVASNDARNLPFNNMQIQSYTKLQEVLSTQTKETTVETQTEPRIPENTEILGISSINSSVFQNMGALFSAALVWSVAHDFQTLDLVARSLLGFIHIPEYNQAFLAATQMSVIDLQMEYGFSLDDARRAYDSIEYANMMRTTGSLPDDLSSSLSNSNDYLDQTQKMSNNWGWKDYLLLTGVVIIASGTLYYLYQSVKMGTPVDSIQGISPNVEAWKSSLYNKINKL